MPGPLSRDDASKEGTTSIALTSLVQPGQGLHAPRDTATGCSSRMAPPAGRATSEDAAAIGFRPEYPTPMPQPNEASHGAEPRTSRRRRRSACGRPSASTPPPSTGVYSRYTQPFYHQSSQIGLGEGRIRPWDTGSAPPLRRPRND
jgi:hypothetical protein